MTPVTPDDFDKATRRLEDAWKMRMARKGDTYPPVYTIPTGSYELDWAMFGGWPIGRFSRIYGGESTAKTLLMWCAIRNAQNIHHIYRDRFDTQILAAGDEVRRGALEEERDAFLARFPDGQIVNYYNVEAQYHEKFVRQWGVDVERLNVIEGDVIEQVCDAMESYMGSVHLHVVDSTTSASPLRLVNADATDEMRAVDAARWKDGLRRVEHHFDAEYNTVILISQVTNPQVPGRAAAEEPVGGKKMKYSSSMSLHTRLGRWLFYDSNGVLVDKATSPETISGLKEPDGIEITARVAKSRVCPPFRTARIRLDLFRGAGFDLAYEISQAAKFYGMVERGGGTIFLLDDAGERVKPGLRGEAGFREYIRENPDFRDLVRDRMMTDRDSRAGELGPEGDPEEDEPDL